MPFFLLWRKDMAYSGFLIKVGNFEIPLSWMRAETYSVGLHGQDLDSYRDADGILHRQALENVVPKVDFNTPSMKKRAEFAEFMGNIRANYTNATEKKVLATVYIPEIDDYVTQDMYVPDITPSIYLANDKDIWYNEIRIAFIGYGGKA